MTAVDASFAEGLLVYRRQAVQLLDTAPSHTANPEIVQLARGLRLMYQQDEQKLSAIMREWGRPVPPPGEATARPDLPGTISAKDLAELTKLCGPAYDRRLVELLSPNLRGALRLAQLEQAGGASGAARQLATAVAGSAIAMLATLDPRTK